MQSKSIRFVSCFICEVIIDESSIELVDSGHHSFFIEKSNEGLMKDFKDWFVNVFKECVPQTLTVIQYHVDSSNEEPMTVVDKLIYKSHKCKCTTILNESSITGNKEIA